MAIITFKPPVLRIFEENVATSRQSFHNGSEIHMKNLKPSTKSVHVVSDKAGVSTYSEVSIKRNIHLVVRELNLRL